MCQNIYLTSLLLFLGQICCLFCFLRGLSPFDAFDLLRRELSVPKFHAQEPADAVVTSVWDSALSGWKATSSGAPTPQQLLPAPFPYIHISIVYLNYLGKCVYMYLSETNCNHTHHALVRPTDCTNVSAYLDMKANQQLRQQNMR